MLDWVCMKGADMSNEIKTTTSGGFPVLVLIAVMVVVAILAAVLGS